METFLDFKQNQLLRLDLTYPTKLGMITETIFAEFVSLNSHENNPDYYVSVTLNQIINIDDYLNKGSNHTLLNRTIDQHYFRNRRIYFNSIIENT